MEPAARPCRRAAVVAVGSELLGTDRLDTNSLAITALLELHGVELAGKSVVGDRVEDIVAALAHHAAGVDVIVVTGGLGPTRDDRTRDALAAWAGVTLEEDGRVRSWLEEMYARRGRRMPDSNLRQAMVPGGAVVLTNPRGTAPGLAVTVGGVTVFALPGVPNEVEGLLETALGPWIAARNPPVPSHRLQLRVACLPESLVEERIAPLYERFGDDAVAVLASPGEVLVRLTMERPEALEEGRELARSCLGDALFVESTDAAPAPGLEAVVGQALHHRRERVSVAESCTGGLIGGRLTAVAGSSAWFEGGAITYSNALKERMLGVDGADLRRHGAVSEEVSRAMAEGAATAFGTHWAVSVTGVAGPGGGTEEKPVGTVWFAVSGAVDGDRGGTTTARVVFPGDRSRIRRQASQYALDMLRRRVTGLSALADLPWLAARHGGSR